jgi:DNA-binding IclR family transcriptional regulator
MFRGIKVEDALAVLATFKGILSLKSDIDLRLKLHVTAFARAIGSRNDGSEARPFFTNEIVTFENFGFNFF